MYPNDSAYYHAEIGGIGAVLECPGEAARFRTQRNIAMHTHITYELYFLYEGEAKILTEDKTYRIRAGQLALVTPNTYHAIVNVSKTFRLGAIYLQIYRLAAPEKNDPEYLAALLDLLEDASVLQLREQPELFRVMRQIIAEQAAQVPASECLLRAYTTELLVLLLRALPKPEERTKKTEKRATLSVSITRLERMQVIEEYVMFHCSMADITTLADRLCISEQHLRRFLREAYGMTFTELLNRQRVQICKHLLQTTAEPINRIWQQVGFQSPQYFSVAFKRYTGMTASQYRSRFR